MNNLARLPHVRTEMNASGTTSQDDDIVRAVERASRFAEVFTARDFVARLATRHLSRGARACGRELRLSQDLSSITTLTVDEDGDDTYELTLVEDTDYFLVRERDGDSNTPILRLDLNPNGTQLSSWPTARRAIKITGLWGYSYELEASTLVTAEALDTVETAIDIGASAASLIYAGDTVVVDSEQMEVTSVSPSGSVPLTVVRGINGTVAAAHDTGAAIYIRRYPREVERAVSADAARYLWWASRGMMDQAGVVREPWPMIRDALMSYRRWAVG